MNLAELPAEQVLNLGVEVVKGDTARALALSYVVNNGVVKQKNFNSLLKIFEAACLVGHNKWPVQIRSLVEGKNVLDVGCGTTFYGAVLRALGAKSYTGIDPRVDLNKKMFRSRIEKGSVKTEVSLTQVLMFVDRIIYHHDLPDDGKKYDLALLHTVTHQLMDIDGTFGMIASTLRPNGAIWFLHDNFYSWAGHHLSPHSVKVFDPTNADHLLYADWKHLTYDPAPEHFFSTGLNRIRLDDLKAATERYFDIEMWQEVPDSTAVSMRLTPEIRNALPDYSERELLTRHVICQARRRG